MVKQAMHKMPGGHMMKDKDMPRGMMKSKPSAKKSKKK